MKEKGPYIEELHVYGYSVFCMLVDHFESKYEHLHHVALDFLNFNMAQSPHTLFVYIVEFRVNTLVKLGRKFHFCLRLRFNHGIFNSICHFLFHIAHSKKSQYLGNFLDYHLAMTQQKISFNANELSGHSERTSIKSVGCWLLMLFFLLICHLITLPW